MTPAMRAFERLRASVPSPPERQLLIQAGTCSQAVGADRVAAALRARAVVRERGIPVIEAGCDGGCSKAVTVTLLRNGCFARRWTSIGAESVDRIAVELDGADESPPAFPGQTRLLSAELGVVDPVDLGSALRRGRYAGLAAALDRDPDAIVAEIERSGLSGRGGAYLAVASKWSECRTTPGARVLIVNAEEGEPGVVKDRHLMEGDPHLLIEGMLIAACAIGAEEAIVYLNGHAHNAGRRLAAAMAEAREAGLIGERVLGTNVRCEVEIRLGAGGYVLGEQTAILESIEGKPPMPRTRPPQPFHAGLHGRPTVINNVETLAAVAKIVEHGADWYRRFGSEKSPGTKLVGVSGSVARPGLIEIEIGTTVNEVIAACGGTNGREIRTVLAGGPSGIFMPPSDFDRPLVPRDDRAFLGSGNLTVIDVEQDLVEIVRAMARFNADESCGKCAPCREGTRVMVEMLDRVLSPAGTQHDRDELEQLCDVVAVASICGLGQMAPSPIKSWLTHFAPSLATTHA